jgi:mannose-6-phosphate isomerase-like protein (cupin superfamily)
MRTSTGPSTPVEDTRQAATQPGSGVIVRSTDFRYLPSGDCLRAQIIGPHVGARLVRLDAIRIPAGAAWTTTNSRIEQIVVLRRGQGFGTVNGERRAITRASAMYCPTGGDMTIASHDGEVEAFVWQSRLRSDRSTSPQPARFSSLWDATTQLRNFAGTGQVTPTDRRATMNFLFWPGNGSAQLCLHCGIQQPGETFSVHLHTASEDAFVAFEGVGQMYLGDRWVDVAEGDVLFAPPMLLHGARNPHAGADAAPFVTCGGPTPFDTVLYDVAGLSSEVR